MRFRGAAIKEFNIYCFSIKAKNLLSEEICYVKFLEMTYVAIG